MQVQMTSVVILFLICNGRCSDADQGTELLDEEALGGFLASEVKQSRHSAPLWQLPLLNMCRMLGSAIEPWQEHWSSEETQAAFGHRLTPAQEQLYDLQTLCRILRPRQLRYGEEYLQVDEDSESPLKRKSPYILKRQLHSNKVRRPYILKRSSFY
ncbi:neurotensin/neuromedin N [Brachyhypopomus gauderio]|uniref:neurotensin/neuromedin N n=1 Tax=Brachyhypopomus gauderio TaxID=698409 RepID=UPI0040438F37